MRVHQHILPVPRLLTGPAGSAITQICMRRKRQGGVNEDEREYCRYYNSWYITAQKIIIWEKETGKYPKMHLSGLRDLYEGGKT